MAKAFLILMAGIFFFYGLLCTVLPIDIFFYATGASVSSASGIIDLRATYGGMSLGVGALLYTLSRQYSTIRVGLQGTLFIMAGMATSRMLGIVTDGPANQIMYLYLILEIIAVAISCFLLKSSTPNS